MTNTKVSITNDAIVIPDTGKLDVPIVPAKRPETITNSKDNINEILELQSIVYNSLNDNEKDFLLPKSKEKILAHFAKGNLVQGYIEDGKLVAQSFITNPSLEYPETGMVDMQDQGSIEEGITVLQGLIVHPDYQGQGLSSKMIHNWIKFSAQQGKQVALAEVEVTNYKSYGGFLHAGLEIDSIGIDQSDGCEVFNIKGNPAKALLKQAFNFVAPKIESDTVVIPAQDVKSIKQAFNNNYKATYWDKYSKQLVFEKKFKPSIAMQMVM